MLELSCVVLARVRGSGRERETTSLVQARRVFDVVLISLRLPGNEGLTRGDPCTRSPLTAQSPLSNQSALPSAFTHTIKRPPLLTFSR
jgi:hypothetical protein